MLFRKSEKVAIIEIFKAYFLVELEIATDGEVIRV